MPRRAGESNADYQRRLQSEFEQRRQAREGAPVARPPVPGPTQRPVAVVPELEEPRAGAPPLLAVPPPQALVRGAENVLTGVRAFQQAQQFGGAILAGLTGRAGGQVLSALQAQPSFASARAELTRLYGRPPTEAEIRSFMAAQERGRGLAGGAGGGVPRGTTPAPAPGPLVGLTGQPQYRGGGPGAALPDVQLTPTGELPPGTPLARLTAAGVEGQLTRSQAAYAARAAGAARAGEVVQELLTGDIAGAAAARAAITQRRLADAARWTGQAINAGKPPTTMTPSLQQTLGLTNEQMLAMGYVPNPNGYWELQAFGPPGGGGGGGGGRRGARGGGGRGGRAGGVGGGVASTLYMWRI